MFIQIVRRWYYQKRLLAHPSSVYVILANSYIGRFLNLINLDYIKDIHELILQA